MKTVSDIAEYLVQELKELGFKIQLYKAVTTKSTYIKLDYGVCNSIRISDHNGKKHLQYRYNIQQDCKEYYVAKSPEGWDRYYYPFSKVDFLIKRVVLDRKMKMDKYGAKRYKQFMDDNYRDGRYKKGFWSDCVEV